MRRARTPIIAIAILASATAWTNSAVAQEEWKCLLKRAAAASKYQQCILKWQSRCLGLGSCDQPRLSACRQKYAQTWPELQALAGTSCNVARFVNNADGTVTDNLTGLVWELKDDLGGVHDVDNTYDWSGGPPWLMESGSAFTGFLATLNGGGGFTGASGWRLPTYAELQTILVSPCNGGPCTDPIFGPTQSGLYWTATTFSGHPDGAWFVDFGSGLVSGDGKSHAYFVRAVRSGL